MIENKKLQIVYLGIALVSSFCSITKFYVIPCSNIVGIMCLLDFYIIKNKDMILHHTIVLALTHYMNQHHFENKNEIICVVLNTEISTIFLTTHNLLNTNIVVFKNINKLFFISTFLYYRIYNYSQLLIDNNIHNTLYVYSRNNFEYCEIYASLYGLFLLNLYWSYLIFKKCIK
jgi:hypothetical protein